MALKDAEGRSSTRSARPRSAIKSCSPNAIRSKPRTAERIAAVAPRIRKRPAAFPDVIATSAEERRRHRGIARRHRAALAPHGLAAERQHCRRVGHCRLKDSAASREDASDDSKDPISPEVQARILSEALPYMQRYDEEIVVIKYGGHAMGDEHLARDFARDIVLLEQTAINPVVVHGGGPQIEAMLKKVGVKSQFAAGLRITDEKTLEIVEMVLAGSINKQIVGYINAAGGKAVGLCGKDGNMVMARKLTRTVVDPDSADREGGRSRLCRRTGQSRCHRAHPDSRPRTDSGAGAGRRRARTAAPSTSTPTLSPAPSPARSRPSGCCCSPTSPACSTNRRS